MNYIIHTLFLNCTLCIINMEGIHCISSMNFITKVRSDKLILANEEQHENECINKSRSNFKLIHNEIGNSHDLDLK